MKFAPLILMLTLATATAHAAPDSFMNVLVNPLALLAGPNVQVDFRVSDNWTVGPQLLYINRTLGDYDIHAFSAGMNATYYYDKVFTSGWYTQGGLGYSAVKLTAGRTTNSEAYSSTNQVYLHGMGGYHWFLGDFNLRLGAGLTAGVGHSEHRDGNGNETGNGPSAPIGLAAEASLGWTF